MEKEEQDSIIEICNKISDLINGKKDKIAIEILTTIADDVVSQLRSLGEDY